MIDRPFDPAAQPGDQPERDTPEQRLLMAAYGGDINGIQAALKLGADINATHPETGLSALHIAVGVNDIFLCRYLVEKCSVGFFPDRFGRWPTLIAAECQVDDALSDYIVEAEARYLEEDRTS